MVRVTVSAACFGLFHVSLDALEKSVNDMPASNIKAYLDVVIFIKECVLGDIKLFEVIVIKYKIHCIRLVLVRGFCAPSNARRS